MSRHGDLYRHAKARALRADHSGFDGIRWKSSHGAVRNSRLGVKYLEVTPLQVRALRTPDRMLLAAT